MWKLQVIIAVCCLTSLGCGLWNPTAEPPSQLPQLRPASNKAMLDIAFLRVPADEAALSDLWTELDEQHMDGGTRSRLAENGIRCGIVGRQLSPSLEKLVERSKEQTQAQTGLVQGVTIQRFQCSLGDSRQLAATAEQEQLIVLHKQGQSVVGNTYSQAQCFFDLRCDQASADTVRLLLTPEIHHGEPRRHFNGSQGAIQFTVRKDKVTYEDLTIATHLSAGQTLVLASAADPKGLGANFFVQDDGGVRYTKLLLVRLVQAPDERLFPSNSSAAEEPLADDWP